MRTVKCLRGIAFLEADGTDHSHSEGDIIMVDDERAAMHVGAGNFAYVDEGKEPAEEPKPRRRAKAKE
jgi:hypothetical protein